MTPPPDAVRISVIMPVYNTPKQYLREAVDSVLAQSYPWWELVMVDDASTAPDVAEVLDWAESVDARVKVLRQTSNSGIAATSNVALAASTGDFVALMDHDDLLESSALELVARVIAGDSRIDFLYSDEDRLDTDGLTRDAFLKPDWSPDRLRSHMYVGHLLVLRRSLVVEIGGFRIGFDGSQDYDLALRVSERARHIVHIPEVLYHWRLTPGSVSAEADPAVFDAARRALEDHAERIGITARVEQTHPAGVYRMHREVKGEPLVSLVIPTRGSRGTVRGRERIFVVEAVKSILDTSTYTNLEFVIVADRSMDRDVERRLKKILGKRLTLLWYDLPFNYSHKTNLGVAASSGEYLVLLNDDIEVISPDWIEVLLGLAQQPDVGLVGTMLYFEDRSIQHAGHLYADQGLGHIAYARPGNQAGPSFGLLVEREVSGVTAACAMISYRNYIAVGGLSRLLPVNFNDVDLSLKIARTGLRIIWTPHAELYHFESKSRVPIVMASELEIITKRWGRLLDVDRFWRYGEAAWTTLHADPVSS